jgi:hypothetical protein
VINISLTVVVLAIATSILMSLLFPTRAEGDLVEKVVETADKESDS